MLNINIIVIKLCSKKISVEEALIALEELSDQYQIIEDPWYEFQLLYNQKQLAALIHHEEIQLLPIHQCYITDYFNTKTKFYILKRFQIQSFQVELCLGLSPNWRY